MKKFIFSLLAIVLFAGTLYAQAPKGFNYQAVVRNPAGQLMANRSVSVRINILQGAANGTTVYQQTDNVTTNASSLWSWAKIRLTLPTSTGLRVLTIL